MTLRNRVTPLGDIIADPARGTFMGNRGVLHSRAGVLGSMKWKHKHWIICALKFKDRKRTLMSPGQYTELFFCDEATALAAGHRPCWECRRADAARFTKAWCDAHHVNDVRVGEMDEILHASRITPESEQVRFREAIGKLPDGAIVAFDDQPDIAWLLWKGSLHRWTPAGYTESMSAPRHLDVHVLTPQPTVAALAAGYRPKVHGSIGST